MGNDEDKRDFLRIIVMGSIEDLEIKRDAYLEDRSEKNPELFYDEWQDTEEGKELNRLYDLLDELKGDE